MFSTYAPDYSITVAYYDITFQIKKCYESLLGSGTEIENELSKRISLNNSLYR